MTRPITALAVAAVLAWTGLARAGATTPDLILSGGTGTAGSVRTLRVDAAYDYSNALQADYDIELIVFQGTTFARFPLSGIARTGTSPALSDGLGVGDLPAHRCRQRPGRRQRARGGLRRLQPRRALPDTFEAGSITASLAATVDEGPLVSNPLVVVLP